MKFLYNIIIHLHSFIPLIFMMSFFCDFIEVTLHFLLAKILQVLEFHFFNTFLFIYFYLLLYIFLFTHITHLLLFIHEALLKYIWRNTIKFRSHQRNLTIGFKVQHVKSWSYNSIVSPDTD